MKVRGRGVVRKKRAIPKKIGRRERRPSSFEYVRIDSAALQCAIFSLYRDWIVNFPSLQGYFYSPPDEFLNQGLPQGDMYSTFFHGLLYSPEDESHSAFRKFMDRELPQRIQETVLILLRASLNEKIIEAMKAKTADDLLIWSYIHFRFLKYQQKGISSEQGKDVWKSVWDYLEDSPVVQVDRARANAGELERNRQILSFSEWQNDLQKKATKRFYRFSREASKALENYPALSQQIIANLPNNSAVAPK